MSFLTDKVVRATSREETLYGSLSDAGPFHCRARKVRVSSRYERLRTILSLPFSGRNRSGMLSQVLRPIITAFMRGLGWTLLIKFQVNLDLATCSVFITIWRHWINSLRHTCEVCHFFL